MWVSCYYEHLTIARWEFSEIIELPVLNCGPVCFETGLVLFDFAGLSTHSKAVLIFRRVLTHDKQPIAPNRVLQPKSRGNRSGMQRLFRGTNSAFFPVSIVDQ